MNTSVNAKNHVEPVFLEIGRKIKCARLNKGLSATELAKLTGHTKQQISNWENGHRAITLQSVLKLQPVLDISMSSLLCLHKDEQSPSVVSQLEGSIRYDVQDGAMEPHYRKGDTVVFEKQLVPSDGDLVLFLVSKTKQVIFRRYQIDNSNLSYPIIKFVADKDGVSEICPQSEDEYQILGVCKDAHRTFV